MSYVHLERGSEAYERAWGELARRVGGFDRLGGWRYMGRSAKVAGAHAFRLRAGEAGNATGSNMWEHVAL